MRTVFMQASQSGKFADGPSQIASAILTGTMTSSPTETQIRAGGRTIVVTLVNDTWVASGATFDGQRQNILNGIVSSGAEAAGWNAVRSGLAVTDVVRTSASVVTITLDALASYLITANEVLTMTIPGSSVVGGGSIVGSPQMTIADSGPTAAVTGTASSGWYESDVVAGGDTIILTLDGETWVASGATFNAQRQNILDGIVAASSPSNGWNNSRPGLAVTDVVRTSASVVTITLDALASYSVTANETLTITVPGTALAQGNALVATQTLTVIEGTAPAGGTLNYSAGNWCTYEPVDANTLMADDFSRGSWYAVDYDTAISAGTLNALDQMGWGGTIYANPITPPKAIVGGGVGLHGRQYAATSGYHTGAIGGRNMANHMYVSGATDTEVYFRIYFQRQSDYLPGHEKMFDLIRPDGTMLWLCYNYFGSNTIRSIPYLHQDDARPIAGANWLGGNVGGFVTCQNGRWYCYQAHVRLNTPGTFNGVFEDWLDDCGTDGRSPPASPTMRSQYTDIQYRNVAESSSVLGGIWIENWANEPSTGTTYYANVYVSRVGPIPFARTTDQP